MTTLPVFAERIHISWSESTWLNDAVCEPFLEEVDEWLSKMTLILSPLEPLSPVGVDLEESENIQFLNGHATVEGGVWKVYHYHKLGRSELSWSLTRESGTSSYLFYHKKSHQTSWTVPPSLLEELSHAPSRLVADLSNTKDSPPISTIQLFLRACELRGHLVHAIVLLRKCPKASLLGALLIPTGLADDHLDWNQILFTIADDTDITCTEAKDIITVLISLLDRLVKNWLDVQSLNVYLPEFLDQQSGHIAADWQAANRESAESLMRLLLWGEENSGVVSVEHFTKARNAVKKRKATATTESMEKRKSERKPSEVPEASPPTVKREYAEKVSESSTTPQRKRRLYFTLS